MLTPLRARFCLLRGRYLSLSLSRLALPTMLDFLFKRCGGDVESAVELASLAACSEADGALQHVTLAPRPPRALTVLLVILLISAAVCGGVLTYELGARTHTALPTHLC